MIKGVNHRIIEVCQTDHPYFERALLFVRSTYAEESSDSLEKEGRAFLSKAEAFSDLQQARAMKWFKRCVLVLLGGVGGVLLGAFLSGLA